MKNKLTFSLFFTFIICIFNAINFALDGILFDKFAMLTQSFFSKMELWRIISFPVFFNSFEGILLFGASFYFISPRLEYFFSKKIYPIFLSLITLLIGTLTALVFVNSNITFGGLEGTSLFILTLFVLLVNKKIIYKDTSFTNVIALSTFLFWLGIKFYLAQTQGLHSVLPSVVMSATGASAGLLVFWQINYLVKSRIKRTKAQPASPVISVNIKDGPTKDAIGHAIYSNTKFQRAFGQGTSLGHPFLSDLIAEKLEDGAELRNAEKQIDEDARLDEILDKIQETGQEALAPADKDFLLYYSQKLQHKS